MSHVLEKFPDGLRCSLQVGSGPKYAFASGALAECSSGLEYVIGDFPPRFFTIDRNNKRVASNAPGKRLCFRKSNVRLFNHLLQLFSRIVRSYENKGKTWIFIPNFFCPGQNYPVLFRERKQGNASGTRLATGVESQNSHPLGKFSQRAVKYEAFFHVVSLFYSNGGSRTNAEGDTSTSTQKRDTFKSASTPSPLEMTTLNGALKFSTF